MEESNVEFREWLELLDECKYAQLKEEINEENAAKYQRKNVFLFLGF